MGVGRAWKERRMVTIRRRKMERDMRREMVVKHKKKEFFFFYLWREECLGMGMAWCGVSRG